MNLCAGSTYMCYNTIQSRKLKKHIAIKLKQTLWKQNGDAPVASERFSNISLPFQNSHQSDGKFGACWKSQAAGLAPFHRSKGRGLPSESQRLNGQMDRRTIQFYLKWQKARDLEEHSEKNGVRVQNSYHQKVYSTRKTEPVVPLGERQNLLML